MNKMHIFQICPDENELSMFIEGKLTGERMKFVKRHLESCSLCNESVRLALELNAIGGIVELAEDEIVQSNAAKTFKNLCVIYAEQYILQLHGYSFEADELKEIAIRNKWLKKKGVKFKNIGKLLEEYHIEVERKSKCTLTDIQKALDKGYSVMVGVDKGELFASNLFRKAKEKVEDWIEQRPDHALIVKEIIPIDGSESKIVLLNFENNGLQIYDFPASRFVEAWEDSGFYMVIAKSKN
jgi:hypothetical protein